MFIGLANGILGFGYALFSIPAGVLGGRYGYRRMMTIGASICTAMSALLPVALFLSGDLQKIWLIAAYGLYGIAGALVPVNGVPFIMESSTDKERDHLFAFMSAAPAVAGFAGSVVGGLLPRFFELISKYSLGNPHPFAYSLWAVPIMYVLILVAIRTTTRVKRVSNTYNLLRSTRPPYGIFAIFAFIVLLRGTLYFSVTAFLNVYLDTVFHTPTPVIGMIAAFGRLAAVPGALSAPLLVSRWRRHRPVLIIATLLCAAGLPVSLIARIPAITFSLIAIGAMSGALEAIFLVYSQKIIAAEYRGLMSGSIALAAGAGYAATMYGGGFIIEKLGFRPLYLLCCGLVLASALIFFVFFGGKKACSLRALANA